MNKYHPNDRFPHAERGKIYEWVNNGESRYCLVVSNDSRGSDHLVSILFLSTFRGHKEDSIEVYIDKVKYSIHTDLVTYTSRKFLTREIKELSEYVMEAINSGIMSGLGLL